MDERQISEKDVEKQIEKMKLKKTPGPDGLKVELYQETIESRDSLRIVAKCYEVVLKETQEEDFKWRKSKTTLA